MGPGGGTVMSIGEQLRQAREQHNVSLHAIAEKTNISVRFLDAIEKGQIDKLPGGIFTRGFVRSYAAQVGLDPDDTVRAFVAAHPEVRADDEVEEAQLESRAGATWRLVAIAVAVAILLGGGAYWWLTRAAPAPPVSQSSGLPPALPGASPSDRLAGENPSVATAPAAVPPAAPGASTQAPAQTTSAPPADTPAETPAASTLPLRLTVTPTGRCWVQVKADGRVRLAREVVAGERVDIEAADQLEIVAGDAGAFAYQINGAPGRSLGATGRVGRATITVETLPDFRQPPS
jgi:cytoskeletal protein RodZ